MFYLLGRCQAIGKATAQSGDATGISAYQTLTQKKRSQLKLGQILGLGQAWIADIERFPHNVNHESEQDIEFS